MAKILDPILPVLSMLGYWAIILGSFGGPGNRYVSHNQWGFSRGYTVASITGLVAFALPQTSQVAQVRPSAICFKLPGVVVSA